MQETKYLKEDIRNIERLMTIPVFKHFEIDSLAGLIKRSKIREYENLEYIIKEGDTDPWLYFLLSGKVRIEKKGKTIDVMQRAGDIFGEMSMIDSSKRSASALSIGKTVCLATDTDRIKEISGNDKLVFSYILYRIFAETIAERLRTTTNELIRTKEQLDQLIREDN